MKHVLFPLGELTKKKVRELARKFKLFTAEKEESQEICFVEDNDYAKYIRSNYKVKNKPGKIVDKNGKELGMHKGIINFTIGQRRGLGVTAKVPLYVNEIRTEKNEVAVGERDEVLRNSLLAVKINMLDGKPIKKKFKAKVKLRYKNIESQASITPVKEGLKIDFEKPQWAITPGQSVVFYKNDEVLGGGIIEKTI